MYPMQSEAHLYNGYTIEYIQANLHPAMHPVDIEHYMNNVKEVIRLANSSKISMLGKLPRLR